MLYKMRWRPTRAGGKFAIIDHQIRTTTAIPDLNRVMLVAA
jgi:hypothetical protein